MIHLDGRLSKAPPPEVRLLRRSIDLRTLGHLTERGCADTEWCRRLSTGIFAEFAVRGSLVVDDDPIATAENIAESPGLFGVGIGADVVMIRDDWQPEIPGVDEVGAWLDANRPSSAVTGIIHGDYHTANVMYRYDGPQLAAIVDWELTTIGDQLIDLGLIIAFRTPDDEGGVGPGGGLVEAFPSVDELVAHYAQRTGHDVSAASWYGVLACYKTGIILEGTHARAIAGKAPKETGDHLHAITLSLFRKAARLIRET